VQPINPATGAEEQNLTSLPGVMTDANGNTNMSVPPGTLPGGDGYNPWATGAPPPGAPSYPSGGQTVTIDPNNPSPFMRDSGCVMQPSGILLCPTPAPRNRRRPQERRPPTQTPHPPLHRRQRGLRRPRPQPNRSAQRPRRGRGPTQILSCNSRRLNYRVINEYFRLKSLAHPEEPGRNHDISEISNLKSQIRPIPSIRAIRD
jgi:hypothetical protein